MLIIAVIGGAILGGAWGNGLFGVAVGAALAWLIVRSTRQEAALAELRRLLAARPAASPVEAQRPLAAAPAAAREPTGVEPAQPAQELAMPGEAHPSLPDGPSVLQAPAARAAQEALASVEASPAPASTNTSANPSVNSAANPAAIAPPPPMAAPPSIAVPAPHGRGHHETRAGPTPPPARDWLAPAKSWLFGGNTIVKLGVAILFIGLAFLAKLASEHVHLSVEVRLAFIAAAAIGLLAFGWRLRLRRAGYAQVLQGAAVAALFLTLFVAFRTYHVLPGAVVFVLMVAVAALAAALAVLQDAKALAVIGALGGFATPLLVSTGSGNVVALFGYYLVLDLGIAAVAWFKHWRALNLIGFMATFGVATVWGLFEYRPERYAESQAFLIAFFLLFAAIGLMPVRRLAAGSGAEPPAGGTAGAPASTPAGETPPARSAAWVNGSLLFGLPTITFGLQLGLVRHWPFGSALSALALAAFYVGLALWMRRRAELRVTFEASLAIAAVFLTLVIPFALDARSTAGAWALEGAGLVWLGFRQSRRLARGFGYALLLLAGPTLLWAYERHGAPAAIFNAYLFNGVMLVVGALFAAFVVRRAAAAAQTMPGEAWAEPLLVAWATWWAVATTGMQIGEFVQHPYAVAAWLAAGSALALGFTALSVRLAWPAVAWPVMLHALLLALMTLEALVALRQPLARGGLWAWPLALATHLAVLRWAAPRWPGLLQQSVHVIGVLVLATLGALGGRALMAEVGDAGSAWPWLGWLVVPALLLMLMLRPTVAARWPLAAAPRAYGLVAAGLLAWALWGWSLLANLMSHGAARPLPHVPLLNPLDLGVGVALLGVWMWLRSAPVQASIAARPWVAPAVLGSAGFVWLNAILIRAFHHYGGVPYRPRAWLHSLPVHTGITLLWTATALALMWLAARRAARAPWMVGAVLLAAVVLKLVVVDLSGSGTVTRIVSFIGVGVLMLVIGYVAPLPAKRAAASETMGAGDGKV